MLRHIGWAEAALNALAASQASQQNKTSWGCMQGLFEDAVVNGWLHRRTAHHEAARRPGVDPQGGPARSGAGEPGDSPDGSHAWEPDEGLSSGGSVVDDDFAVDEEEDEEGEEDEDEEEEDDIDDFGDFLPQGVVQDDMWSPIRTRQHKPPSAHVAHCLRGSEPVRDSELWLNAQDDCVVQRFDGVLFSLGPSIQRLPGAWLYWLASAERSTCEFLAHGKH